MIRFVDAYEQVISEQWVHPESYFWELKRFPAPEAGPRNIEDEIEVDQAFKLLWDVRIEQNFVDKINDRLHPDVRPTDIDEMYCYDAQFLRMCIQREPTMKHHWATHYRGQFSPLFDSRDRWLYLHRNLHFNRFDVILIYVLKYSWLIIS